MGHVFLGCIGFWVINHGPRPSIVVGQKIKHVATHGVDQFGFDGLLGPGDPYTGLVYSYAHVCRAQENGMARAVMRRVGTWTECVHIASGRTI